MPFPKCTTIENGAENDCFRIAIAKYLDEHPRKVKFIKPNIENFWYKWMDYIRLRYSKKLNFWWGELYEDSFGWQGHISELIEQDKEWIAIVPSLSTKNTHAVNMKGDSFVGDFTGVRKRKPKKFLYGVTLDELV